LIWDSYASGFAGKLHGSILPLLAAALLSIKPRQHEDDPQRGQHMHAKKNELGAA
jgi:hypothetical protein